jgi:putative endonuclease
MPNSWSLNLAEGSPTQQSGALAETWALEYLQAQGLQLLAKNFRCALGEVDLVMQEAKELVFIEVRQRQSKHFGGALGSVSLAKQRRLQKAAQWWLMKRYGSAAWPSCRFDVLAFEGSALAPLWVRAAF